MEDQIEIQTIDCHYHRPGLACAFLIIKNGRAIFIENNTNYAIPLLLDALNQNGLETSDVDYAIITHVHLDHAGGSGMLLEHCKNAKLVAHPRAAKHMIDPTRLVESSISVYGEETFHKLYGEIKPVPEQRVQIMNDEEELTWQGVKFHFLHTRGHANHHFCIFEESSKTIFTGDSFGIAYPALQEKGPFLFPSSTPTDFDAEAARASIDRIVNTGAVQIGLTHFGLFRDIEEGQRQLHAGLDEFEEILNYAVENLNTEEIDDYCDKKMNDFFNARIEQAGLSLSQEQSELMAFDRKLNASGIAFAARKQKKKIGS